MTIDYKVLTQKDKFLTGKFDPESLEKAVNSYAEQGYAVSTCATASFPSLVATREEMIVVLERDASGGSAMYEYKILTQKDKWFTGKFDPETLERAINSYSEQGWSVRATATAKFPSLMAQREEIIVILERQK